MGAVQVRAKRGYREAIRALSFHTDYKGLPLSTLYGRFEPPPYKAATPSFNLLPSSSASTTRLAVPHPSQQQVTLEQAVCCVTTPSGLHAVLATVAKPLLREQVPTWLAKAHKHMAAQDDLVRSAWRHAGLLKVRRGVTRCCPMTPAGSH